MVGFEAAVGEAASFARYRHDERAGLERLAYCEARSVLLRMKKVVGLLP